MFEKKFQLAGTERGVSFKQPLRYCACISGLASPRGGSEQRLRQKIKITPKTFKKMLKIKKTIKHSKKNQKKISTKNFQKKFQKKKKN